MASANGWFLAGVIKRVLEKVGARPAVLTPTPRRPPSRRKPLFEALEYRLLLSADPMGTLAAPADPAETSEPVLSAPLTTGPVVSSAPPVAISDVYLELLLEDTEVTVDAQAGVLSNDTGETALTAVLEVGPQNGVVLLRDDGGFTYRPNPDHSGWDEFSYRAKDSAGVVSEPVTVAINITAVPDAPVAKDDTLRITEVAPFIIRFQDLLGNDVDGDMDTLQVAEITTGPEHGELREIAGVGYEYIPNDTFTSEDSFTYTARDDGFVSAPAKVVIALRANTAPEAKADRFFTGVNTQLTVAPEDGVLANDSDADGDVLEAVVVTGPNHGLLTLKADGSFNYTPDADFSGDDSFTYKASDRDLESQATVTITVANTAPTAQGDNYTTGAGIALVIAAEDGLLANDSDANGDMLEAVLVQGPAHGLLTLEADGSFSYTPDADFSGDDSFTYKASDGDLESQATVTITVANAAPTAQGDNYATGADIALVIAAEDGLLANDSDANGDMLEAVLVQGPAHGLLTLEADGSFSYVPDAGFSGEDSFTYQASDGAAQSEPVAVTIEVLALTNHPPVFSSTPVTTFTIDADATGFDGDGVFRVAGAPGESVGVELKWTFREALYNNEVGIYRVSDQDGRVGNLLPGAAGYAKAALAAGNAQVVFASGASAGAHFELQLEGGAMYAFYVIQNGKTSTFLAGNPDNKVDGRPLAFFSIASANPDGFDHVHAEIEAQTGLLKMRWEDLTRGGDGDYNDVVMTATGLAASSDDVLFVYEAHAQDVDGNQLTYRLAQGPQGAFIDPHTGVLNWAATAGCFHFVVLADDAWGGVAEQAFDLTVNARSTDLVIKGTGGKDRIEVSERDGLVTVRVNDVARTYSHVSSLRVDALGGDDEVWLRSLTMGATVDGGDGNDCIDASAVAQVGVVLYGGAGNDRLTGGAGNDRMDGGTGDDELNGGCGNDVLVGGQGKDCLNGGDGNDLLDGGADNDQLRGGTGNDLLVADSGDDYLKGEDGNDILVGGVGNDSSQGNYGADLIVDGPGCDSNGSSYNSQDRVVDGAAYGIPSTLPAQPPGPVIDWSSRYVALVSALQQFRDHPSNPQWWQEFVNNLGKTEGDANPNSRIRVVGPGEGM